MRRVSILVGAGVLAGSLAVAVVGRAADKKLSPQEIPQKVADSAKARLPGAEITSAEKENENGGVVYDLELKQDGLKYEMDVKQDGTITEIEKQVKDVPEAITKAVHAKYRHAKIKEVMEVSKVEGKKETPQNYEAVIVTADGKTKEVVVSLDGKTAKEEQEQSEGK